MRGRGWLLLPIALLLAGCAGARPEPVTSATEASPRVLLEETWSFAPPTGGTGRKTEDLPFDVPAGYRDVVLTASRASDPAIDPSGSSLAISLVEPEGQVGSRCSEASLVTSSSGEGCRLSSTAHEGQWHVRLEAEGPASVRVLVRAT